MNLEEIEFVVMFDDGAWKLYRDGELVSPYSNREIAEGAAMAFASEIKRVGKLAVVRFED